MISERPLPPITMNTPDLLLDTVETAMIEGRINLDFDLAPMAVTIKRVPSPLFVRQEGWLPTETLLAVAAAFPLEEGECVRIGGLPPHEQASEGATIRWSGDRAREITVTKATFLGPGNDENRRLALQCGPVLQTWDRDFTEATEAGVVRSLCRGLRWDKRQAAAGPTIDDEGNIFIPMGMMKADGTYYQRSYKLKYHPRSCVWTERIYWRFSLGGVMHEFPEVAQQVRAFFDRLPPRQKARALAMMLAA